MLTPASHGLFAYTVIMDVEILVNICLMIAVALVTESKGWTVSAMIAGNLAINVVGYIVAHIPGISNGMFGSALQWTLTATISLMVEFALIAMMLGGAFFIQSKRRTSFEARKSAHGIAIQIDSLPISPKDLLLAFRSALRRTSPVCISVTRIFGLYPQVGWHLAGPEINRRFQGKPLIQALRGSSLPCSRHVGH